MKYNGDESQAVVISRSGKTSETVRAAKALSGAWGVPTIGLTCAVSSDLEQMCDSTIALRTADEKSMVMTRSFTTMLSLCRFWLPVGRETRSSSASFSAWRKASRCGFIPLHKRPRLSSSSTPSGTTFFSDKARLWNCEGSFAQSDGDVLLVQPILHTLEFRHGPKAIVSPGTCLMFFLSETGREAEKEVLAEMKELGGVTIAVCHQADDSVSRR